jgi:Cdc6-like AAA superfamily ATPase
MAGEDIETYIQKSREEVQRLNSDVRDFRVFDFNFIPEKPLIRAEAKRLIDLFIRYQQTGIPRNLVVIGARGSGKTLMLKYLSRTFSSKLQLPFQAVNCRVHNTSFKALAHMLKVRPCGYSYSELCDRFEKEIPGKCIVVLDEVDLLSEKDFRKDILYFLSRSPNRYSIVLLSNNPKFLNTLDESTRSSLQPDVVFFRNYSANEILDILKDRAAIGLGLAGREILQDGFPCLLSRPLIVRAIPPYLPPCPRSPSAQEARQYRPLADQPNLPQSLPQPCVPAPKPGQVP